MDKKIIRHCKDCKFVKYVTICNALTGNNNRSMNDEGTCEYYELKWWKKIKWK